MVNFSPDSTGLAELIDRILDKGLIINADIRISLAGTEILGIKIRAALASFETAAKFGLAFPSGTNLQAPAWKGMGIESEACSKCGGQIFAGQKNNCSCDWDGVSQMKSGRANKSVAPFSEIPVKQRKTN